MATFNVVEEKSVCGFIQNLFKWDLSDLKEEEAEQHKRRFSFKLDYVNVYNGFINSYTQNIELQLKLWKCLFTFYTLISAPARIKD